MSFCRVAFSILYASSFARLWQRCIFLGRSVRHNLRFYVYKYISILTVFFFVCKATDRSVRQEKLLTYSQVTWASISWRSSRNKSNTLYSLSVKKGWNSSAASKSCLIKNRMAFLAAQSQLLRRILPATQRFFLWNTAFVYIKSLLLGETKSHLSFS